MYTVDFFIEHFKSIPKNFWCTGVYDKMLWNDEFTRQLGMQHCSLGHCKHIDRMNKVYIEGEAKQALLTLFETLHVSPIEVNDDMFNLRYQAKGNDPQERILNALYDIKRKLQIEQQEQDEMAGERAVQQVKQILETEPELVSL